MRGVFPLFSFRPLLRKKGRVALSASAVAIGVAVFVATAGTNRAVLTTLEETARSVAGGADLEVRAVTGGVPRAFVERAREVEGVAAAIPLADSHVRVTDPPGVGWVLALGVDLADDALLRTFRGAGKVASANPLLLLSGGGALLSRTLAEEAGIAAGGTFEISGPTGRRRLAVAGLLEPEGAARAFGARVLVLPIGLAESVLGTPGKCRRIEIVLDEGADREAARAGLAAVVGEGFVVGPPGGEAAQWEGALGPLRAVVSLTSLVALGIAVFLVYNAAALAAAERTVEFARLRALGATRGAVVALFVGESALVGLLGALPGVGVGFLLADAATALFVRDVASAYFLLPGVEASRSAADAALGLAAGVLAGSLAALVPALRLGRVAPLEALRQEIGADPLRLPHAARVGFALGSLALGVLAHALGPARVPHAGWIAAFALALAGLAGAWPAARALAAPLAPVLRRLSPVAGRFAHDGFVRAPGRIGFTALAIATCFALALHVPLVVASFRSAFDAWMATTLGGDLWIFHGEGRSATALFYPFAPEVLDEVRSIPGVRAVDGARIAYLPFRGRTVMLTAYGAETHSARGSFFYLEGDEAKTRREVPGKRGALVSEGFAWRFGARSGDAIRLPTPKGEREYRIAGVVVDYGWPDGVVLLDRAVYVEDFEDPFLDDGVVVLEPGADREEVRRGILERLSDRYAIHVLTLDEFRTELLRILDRFWSLTRAQVAVTLVLAFLGVVNAAWIGTIVGSRELGLLRAVGAPRRTLFRRVAIEAVLLGVVGGTLGVLGGIALAADAVSGLSLELGGFSVPLLLPIEPVLQVFGGSIVSSLAASLLPAWRAARLPVLEAIAYE